MTGRCQRRMGGYTKQMAVPLLVTRLLQLRHARCPRVPRVLRGARPIRSPASPAKLERAVKCRSLPAKWASHHLAAVGQRASARVTTSVRGVQPTTATASWPMPTGRPCLVRVLCACYWFRCTLCECTIAVSCRACYWSRCPLCECTIAVSCRVNSAAHPDGGALDTALGRQSRHEGLLPVLVLHVPTSQDRLLPVAPP